MNPHKESWQQSVGLVPKPLQAPQLRGHVMHIQRSLFSGKSDRTKWERIGRPIFVEQPLALLALMHPYSPPVLRLKGAIRLYELYFGE